MKDAEKINLKLNLTGDFNIMNAIAAISVANAYGVDLGICKTALEKVKCLSGRMETILESPVKVVVDYAHTPAQLEAVYKTLLDDEQKKRPDSYGVFDYCWVCCFFGD